LEEAQQHSALDAARRIKGFRRHVLGYAAALALLFGINMLTAPENPWFVAFMVGWGAPLALHAAWAMGLFGGPRRE
jgi:hypothetical protein